LARGRVKWFSDEKGYGFIESESGEALFVHYSQIVADGFKTLREGAPVEFEVVDGSRRREAARVRELKQD
jgi:CspA family cold shock protein